MNSNPKHFSQGIVTPIGVEGELPWPGSTALGAGAMHEEMGGEGLQPRRDQERFGGEIA